MRLGEFVPSCHIKSLLTSERWLGQLRAGHLDRGSSMTECETDVSRLLQATRRLIDTLERTGDSRSVSVCGRLSGSVLRSLARFDVADDEQGATPEADPMSTAVALFQLARDATLLRMRFANIPELAEATAALQDLALQVADEPRAEAYRSELAYLQADLEASIQVSSNGPYLVTNAQRLLDWLGEPLPTRPQMALCRCGRSRIKPLCDGTHASIAFTDEKDASRVADRLDTHTGQQVTILDNRGTCQHSGFCTDRLATVFRLREEPFVRPSGGRMDEIIRAVRDCPSGALSYAIDGVEAREDVDYHSKREPTIEVSKDGPYRVTGGIRLVDHRRSDVVRNQGASYEHYTLCRCGHSQNKPFCTGVHWYVEFHDPVPESTTEPAIFQWAGGLPALTRMTRLFYEKFVPEDPLLAPLFATMSPDHPRRVARWLAEVFCGPMVYSSEYGGYPRMLSQHVGKNLTEEQRSRWVALLLRSANEAGLPNDAEFRSAFSAYIEWGSRLAVENSQTNARPPEHMAMPHWDWNTAAGPPSSRVSALKPAGDTDEVHHFTMPGPDEAVSFERHLKALFRPMDRNSMRFAFDLWNVDDVRKHGQAILGRLRAGSMPCDGAWPREKVDVFERWVNTGTMP
jgi:CDGSH-type Zn-finger protein/truncated hemoglobin YjbI